MDEVRENGLSPTVDQLMALLAESAIKPMRLHVPLRAWQERDGSCEISWLCSCGCHNKHVLLPADLRCVDDKEDSDD